MSQASPAGRGASPGIPACRDPLPVPQGSCLSWLGVGRSLPCPCFVPADCFIFCFPSSPSLPCHHPRIVSLIPLPAVSPSLPCPLPCLLSHFPSPSSMPVSVPACPHSSSVSHFPSPQPFLSPPVPPTAPPAGRAGPRSPGRGTPVPVAGLSRRERGAGPAPPPRGSHKALPSLRPREPGEKCPKPGSERKSRDGFCRAR